MSEEEVWKKRFQLFAAVRLVGVAIVLLGIAVAFSDLVRPGGWRQLGGILIVVGAIDAIVIPRILHRGWKRLER
jgi:hypothetical protein